MTIAKTGKALAKRSESVCLFVLNICAQATLKG